MMVQLVVNLVNNAIAYTPAGSHIVISIGVHDGCVACSVADDGPGIAPEDRERIFESFYTANHGLADSCRSVGLGLSLCRSIALAHGGSIEVTAADPHGSVFTIAGKLYLGVCRNQGFPPFAVAVHAPVVTAVAHTAGDNGVGFVLQVNRIVLYDNHRIPFLCGKRAAPQHQQADGGECRQIRNRPLRAHILRVLW